jgi:hypothetical protein
MPSSPSIAALASVEHDSIAAPLRDEPHERLPPLLQRALPQIVAAETQKVEGHQRGLF